MQFTVGQTIIHPHHGPATITALTTRTIKGRDIEYADLRVRANEMNVMIPVANAEEIGIRAVVGGTGLDQLTKVLCAKSPKQENQWARRIKTQRTEVASGDPVRIAAVVRDMVRRRESKGLSLAEKELLKEASEPLVDEIALAAETTPDEAREVMLQMALEECADALERIRAGKAA